MSHKIEDYKRKSKNFRFNFASPFKKAGYLYRA